MIKAEDYKYSTTWCNSSSFSYLPLWGNKNCGASLPILLLQFCGNCPLCVKTNSPFNPVRVHAAHSFLSSTCQRTLDYNKCMFWYTMVRSLEQLCGRNVFSTPVHLASCYYFDYDRQSDSWSHTHNDIIWSDSYLLKGCLLQFRVGWKYRSAQPFSSHRAAACPRRAHLMDVTPFITQLFTQN